MRTPVFLAGACWLGLLHAAVAQDAAGGAGAAIPVTRVIDSYPSPSPDGKRLLFQSDRGGVVQVYVADSDGGNVRRLTDFPGGSRTPKWSPDGATIAYARGSDETSDIWLMDVDGGHQRALVATPGDDSHPQWAPDGRHVVFNSSRPAPDGKGGVWEDIFVVDRDGRDLRRLTDCRSTCTYPALSPDGRLLAYRRIEPGHGLDWALHPVEGTSEVFVAPLNGGHATNLSNDPAFDGWPAWSPDGAWIAFASNRAGPANTGQVWLVHPDGSGLRQLTKGAWSHVQPAWSRDGHALYVYRNQEDQGGEFGHVARVAVSSSP